MFIKTDPPDTAFPQMCQKKYVLDKFPVIFIIFVCLGVLLWRFSCKGSSKDYPRGRYMWDQV